MTTEIEKEFFEAYGIEPAPYSKKCSNYSSHCPHCRICTKYAFKKEYPTITAEIRERLEDVLLTNKKFVTLQMRTLTEQIFYQYLLGLEEYRLDDRNCKTWYILGNGLNRKEALLDLLIKTKDDTYNEVREVFGE
jgi:hypothetical protein